MYYYILLVNLEKNVSASLYAKNSSSLQPNGDEDVYGLQLIPCGDLSFVILHNLQRGQPQKPETDKDK